MAKKKHLILGIDVGTTKIASCIAQLDGDRLEVLGSGLSRSEGLKKGSVVNLTKTIESVRNSLAEAESQANAAVETAYVSVGGTYITAENRTGSTVVQGKNGRIGAEDINRALEEATTHEIPENYEVIHALTQDFSVDGRGGIVDPLGLTGEKLLVKVHLVMIASPVLQNIVNAINKAGVGIEAVVMQQLASSEAVLTSDEKELGAVLIDIGGGTTDISVYHQGSIWHSEVLQMGGSMITKDIAIGLRAPLEEAEQLKVTQGNVHPGDVPQEEVLMIGEMGTGRQRTISRRLLCQIVEARCDEILEATADATKRAGVQTNLVSGAVFTGGGSLMEGLIDRASEILEMPVRIGYPGNLTVKDERLNHPSLSTSLGLLKYAQNMANQPLANLARRGQTQAARSGWTDRMTNWIIKWIG